MWHLLGHFLPSLRYLTDMVLNVWQANIQPDFPAFPFFLLNDEQVFNIYFAFSYTFSKSYSNKLLSVTTQNICFHWNCDIAQMFMNFLLVNSPVCIVESKLFFKYFSLSHCHFWIFIFFQNFFKIWSNDFVRLWQDINSSFILYIWFEFHQTFY